MATFTGTGGSDTFIGGDGTADTFLFTLATLGSTDTVSGGTGTAVDTLQLTAAGTVSGAALANVSGLERVFLANGSNSFAVTAVLGSGSGSTSAAFTVLGGTGNDVVNATAVTAAGRVVFAVGTGADTFTGGAGSDLVTVDLATLFGNDVFQGGGNTVLGDALQINQAGLLTQVRLAGVSAFERLVLANGTNTVLLDDAVVAANGGLLTIIGNEGQDKVDVSGLTGSNRVMLVAGGSADTLLGGAGGDTFAIAREVLFFNDTFVGGGGAAVDTLKLTTAGTVSAGNLTSITGIERVMLANGTNNLTLSNVLATGVGTSGAAFTVVGGSGSDTVDASSVGATGRVVFAAGTGADTFTGGAGSDIVTVDLATLFGNDVFQGGANTGPGDALQVNQAGLLTFARLSGVSGFERLVLATGANNVLLNDAVLAANGGVLTVVGSDGSEVIDASLVGATNRVTILGGLGADTLTGGAGDDVLSANAFDTVNGGAGNDTIRTDSTSQFANFSTFLGGSGNDRIEYNFASDGNPDIVLDGGNDSDTLFDLANDALVIDLGIVGADQTSGDTADVRNFENVDWSASFSVLLATGPNGADINTIIGGAGNDTLNGNGGADFINGNGGDDVLMNNSPGFFATGATFLGGSGDDRIEYNVSPDADGIPRLDGGTDSDTLFDVFIDNVFIDLSIVDADQSAADTLGTDDFSDVRNFENVDWSASGFTNGTFNGSAGSVKVFGSSGANTLLGGMDTDTLLGFGGSDRLVGVTGGGTLLNGDTLDGGNGDDFIQYNNSQGAAATLDGGGGIDTLFAEAGNTTDLVIDLSVGLSQDQTSGDNVVVRNFVSVNWFFSSGKLVATLGDGLDGSLIGGVANNTLIGGDGNNTIGGGGGFNSLTGRGGDDTFRFDIRDTDADRVFDFSNVTGNDDTFQFVTGFGFNTNSASSDFVIVDQPADAYVDIAQADLLRVSDAATVTVATIGQFLPDYASAADGQGLFIVGRVGGVGTDVHLYHVTDAGNPTSIFDIANLGSSFDPATLDASDFVFA